MNIPCLFSTPKRVAIMGAVIFKTGAVSVEETAKGTGTSKGLASKYLDCLASQGILLREGVRYRVRESVETRAVRILLSLDGVAGFDFSRYGFVKGAGVFGSCARGENTERSDLDIWVSVDDVHDEGLAELTGDLRRSLGDVRPIYLTQDKLRLMREEEPAFYNSLLHGSTMVYGENLEAV